MLWPVLAILPSDCVSHLTLNGPSEWTLTFNFLLDDMRLFIRRLLPLALCADTNESDLLHPFHLSVSRNLEFVAAAFVAAATLFLNLFDLYFCIVDLVEDHMNFHAVSFSSRKHTYYHIAHRLSAVLDCSVAVCCLLGVYTSKTYFSQNRKATLRC